MNLHERFQAFCQKCFEVIERDSAAEAIQAAQEHEADCKKVSDPAGFARDYRAAVSRAYAKAAERSGDYCDAVASAAGRDDDMPPGQA